MKKSLLTILTICCFCLTFCQHNNANRNGFIPAEIKPHEYESYNKETVDLQDTDIIKKIHELDCYFECKVNTNSFNGSVLISYKGTPIFERYYGYKNHQTLEKITPFSTFQIASTSKTFTSGAILMLLQQNLLSLDDTIQKFFPAFPYNGISIRMLMNHRSGLPNYLNFSEDHWKNKKLFMTNRDVFDMMIRYKPKAMYKPDTHFMYNNTNFILLALIVEKVSGIPFCDFIQQQIFIPLGMSDSWVFDPLSVRSSATKGYSGSHWREDEIIYSDGVLGDKGIYSTVRDMYKWDQALYAGKFIRPEILGQAFTPQSFEKQGNKNYGLGWRISDQPDGSRLIYHNGWWHSYNTVFNRKISDKTSVIILSNHFSNSIYKIQQVWDILYGENVVKTAEDENLNETTRKLNSEGLNEIQDK